ncbi:MAG TPA: divalent metal cation transporter, partial [Chloroflexota bacterium]|nr:divalent metal cation transporter [Chloroflexota bacterium]
GLSSSAVGTMAGQVIMQGFVGFGIPLWARRIITMVPTLVVVFLGVDPTKSLFYSQVVLSLILPLPVLALLYFTSRRAIMGTLVNPRHTTIAAGICAIMILVLNVLLVAQSAHTITHGLIPGVPGLNN